MSNFFYGYHISAIQADPAYIETLWESHGQRWKDYLGSIWNDESQEHFQLSFCSQLAHETKPYGQTLAFTMEDLCASEYFDCHNYVMFAWRLFDILAANPITSVWAIGWNKPFLGNHAQLIAKHPATQHNLLTDPTIGLHQIGSGFDFDWIASGKPISDAYRRLVFSRHGENASVDALALKVQEAFRDGRQRPSNIIYTLGSVKQYGPGIYPDWPTPGAL